MSLARIPGVERGLLEDVEPGALVWSRTRTHGNDFPVGGIVVAVLDHGDLADDPTVQVIRWNYRPTSPYIYDLTLSDVDAQTATFFSSACDIEAQKFDAYLASLKTQAARREAAPWRTLAASLALFSVLGHYTPRAQRRAEDVAAERMAELAVERDASADQARVDAIMPKMEAAIAEARARRNTPNV